jgi:hypothetical protein
MALMKTGRKGEDPKKPKTNGDNPKNQQEIKVTAKKQYTWDDVSKSEEIKSRNKAAKQQYESDVANYNKAMKLYNEGASYDVSNENLSKVNKSGTSIKGKPVTYTAATGGTSAKEMSDAYDKGIKSGEYVDINDPRISEKNRYYLKGTLLGSTGEESNKWGTVKSRAIPASVAFEKDLNFKKLYGGEDFDPYEFEKASKSGKFDEYSKKKGISGKSFMPSYGGHLEKYGKPEQAKVPAYEKEMSIDVNRVPLPKMEKKKSDVKPLRISESKPTSTEKPDWEAPSGGIKTKSRIVKPYNVKMGDYIGQNIKYAAQKATGKTPILRPGVEKTREALIQGKTGREAKMAKAYFGGGYEGQSKFDIEGTSEERGRIGALKADKADFSKGIREARRSGDKEKVEGYRASRKDVKSEIKQAKLASKYLTKLGQEFTGVREGQELRSTGKIKANTPSAMTGFSGSKQDTYNSDANFNKFLAKSSTDNPANRNTISKQMETVEPKMTRSQRKESRAIQEKVMKNMKN